MRERFMDVREAIDVVLRHLEALPPSDRRELLGAWVRECLKESERWGSSPPTNREREALMKRVLEIHGGVTKLEDDAVGRRNGSVRGGMSRDGDSVASGLTWRPGQPRKIS